MLHPLLNNTQLRNNPHKALLVRHTLENSISHAHIRDIDTTTRRLVHRCLSGEWAKSLVPSVPVINVTTMNQCTKAVDSVQAESPPETPFPSGPGQGNAVSGSVYLHPNSAPSQDTKNIPHRTITRSASVEHLSTAGIEDVGGPLSDLEMPNHVQRRVSIKRTPSKAKYALKARANPKMAQTHEVERSNDSAASLASIAVARHERENQPKPTKSMSLVVEPHSPSSVSDSGVSGSKSLHIRPNSHLPHPLRKSHHPHHHPNSDGNHRLHQYDSMNAERLSRPSRRLHCPP